MSGATQRGWELLVFALTAFGSVVLAAAAGKRFFPYLAGPQQRQSTFEDWTWLRVIGAWDSEWLLLIASGFGTVG